MAPSTPGGTVFQGGDVQGTAVSCPIAIGKYREFDWTNRKPLMKVKVKVLIHGAVTAEDVEFEWVTPQKLKFRIAWPQFFQFPEQMVEFHLKEDGTAKYPVDHPLTIDCAESNASLTEEDGKIYDDGFIFFDSPMKTDLEDLEHEICEVEISSAGKTVLMLEVTA
ncbi:MAG: hypothetical protein SGARI_002826, partial [Bacillariaceae sp.]